MNQRSLLGLIALLVAITSAIVLVLFTAGLPTDAFAAVPTSAVQSGTEPGPLSLLISGAGVVLWLALWRSR